MISKNNTFKYRLCHAIKLLRQKTGLSQEKFSEKAEISYSVYRKYETMKNAPSTAAIDKICTAYNIDIIDLLLLSSPEKSDKQKIIDEITFKLKLLSR